MIYLESLELHIANHCNISCDNCSHMSPIEKEKFIDIDKTISDLQKVQNFLHVGVLRLLGGEPLLNPRLAEICLKLKKLHIFERLSISTNGLLIDSVDLEIWKYIDEIEISIYKYPFETLSKIIKRSMMISKEFNVKIHIYFFKCFRKAFTNIKHDSEITKKIYESCIIANKWQCYNLFEGRLYKCPQAFAIDRHIIKNKEASGVDVENLTEDSINEFIFDKSPMMACNFCLGSCGKKVELSQTPCSKWSKTASGEMIDNAMLENMTDDMDTVDIDLHIENGKIVNLREDMMCRNYILNLLVRCGYPSRELLDDISISASAIETIRQITDSMDIDVKAILECGSYVGVSTLLFSLVYPKAQITTVDPDFCVDSETKELKITNKRASYFYDRVKELMGEEYFSRIRRVKGYFSVHPEKEVCDYHSEFTNDLHKIDLFSEDDQLYDMIFIDGDHSEKSVLNDLEKSKTLLNNNGLIFIHDVAFEYAYDVKNAVNAFLDRHKCFVYKDIENQNIGVLFKNKK